MTDNQIIAEIDKAMELGRKQAYAEIHNIVSGMCATDNNENLNKVLVFLRDKIFTDGQKGNK